MFTPDEHIVNVFTGPEAKMFASDDSPLEGILGVAGASAVIETGQKIGADRIIMESGTRFELHTHPGAHILYVMASRGYIHIDGVDYEMAEGDTVYVPAKYPHGVKTNTSVSAPLEILAFGVPHMPVSSTKRMTLVDDADS